MTVGERSHRLVDETLERLRDEYRDFREIGRAFAVPDAQYEFTVERFEAGSVGGAGAWVTDAAGRVLLVQDRGLDGPWSEPSGKVEPGESLEAAACREVLEETGVQCAIEGLHLANHWRVSSADDPDRDTVHRLVVVFDAVYVDGTVRPQPGEIDDARWWRVQPEDLLYDELADLAIPASDDDV